MQFVKNEKLLTKINFKLQECRVTMKFCQLQRSMAQSVGIDVCQSYYTMYKAFADTVT